MINILLSQSSFGVQLQQPVLQLIRDIQKLESSDQSADCFDAIVVGMIQFIITSRMFIIYGLQRQTTWKKDHRRIRPAQKG